MHGWLWIKALFVPCAVVVDDSIRDQVRLAGQGARREVGRVASAHMDKMLADQAAARSAQAMAVRMAKMVSGPAQQGDPRDSVDAILARRDARRNRSEGGE